MSQSDWNFIFRVGSGEFLNGTSGSAIQHNTLTSPITSSGNWCRGFFYNNGDRPTVAMIPINNSELTSSSGYEYGDGYSLRTWVRMSNVDVGTNNHGFFLIFKGESDLNAQYAYPWIGYRTGYYLFFNNGNGNVSLSCRNNIGITNEADSTDPSYNSYAFINNLFSMPANTWKRLRMDVSPISGAYDKITVFTGSQIEGDWSQIYTVNIPQTKVGAYIPWKNNPNGDGALASGKGYMGAVVFTNNFVGQPVYIDQFEVYKERII